MLLFCCCRCCFCFTFHCCCGLPISFTAPSPSPSLLLHLLLSSHSLLLLLLLLLTAAAAAGSTRSLTRPASVASQRRTRKENLWQQLPFSPRSFAHRRTDAAWPKHADGTFVCLSPAAKQGDADARCSLGVCYDSGKGVQQDKTEAVQRYRKAAEQGDADAQFNLAHTHTHTQ